MVSQITRLYLDGNSLGLLCPEAEAAVVHALDAWRSLAIEGWTQGDHPWFHLSREVAGLLEPLLGALPGTVAMGESVTVNLHQLIASFYQPTKERFRVMVDNLAFPTDRYVVESQLILRGKDIATHLSVFQSDDGQTLDEQNLMSALRDPTLAFALLPAVLYRSGQLLNMLRLQQAASEAGVTILWDCSHSAGIIPHQFTRDGIELAVGCTYKYLNGGPGAVGFLYVHHDRLTQQPGLAGWFGCDPRKQFAMEPTFHPANDAGRFMLGTPHVLSLAPLLGSLKVIHDVGIASLREQSLALTHYLITQTEARLARYGVSVVTPRQAECRGGHVTLRHPHAAQLSLALRQQGIIPDHRPPDLLRLAPAPLSISHEQCTQALDVLEDLLRSGSYRKANADGLVT